MAKDFNTSHQLPAPDACLACASDLTAFFDGEADDASARRACAHLEGCPSCAAAFRDWIQTRALLRDVAPAPLPPTLPECLLLTCRLEGLSQARRMMRDLAASPENSPQASFIEAPPAPPARLIFSRRVRAFAGAAVVGVPVMAASLLLFLARAPQPTQPDARSAASTERASSPARPRLMAQLAPEAHSSQSAPLRVASRPQRVTPVIIDSMPAKIRTPRVLMTSARPSKATTRRQRRITASPQSSQVMLARFEVVTRPRVARLSLPKSKRIAPIRRVKRGRRQISAPIPPDVALTASPKVQFASAPAPQKAPTRGVEIKPIARLAMAEKKRLPVEAVAENDEAMFGGVGDDRPEELSRVVDNYRAALIADTDEAS